MKVYVHPSKKGNNECGPAWKTRRAWPEGHICCALSLGKGATLSVATKHNSCTLQATLSTQGVIQRLPNGTWSKQASGAFYALTLHTRRELFADWSGKLHISQTYDDGYASEDYNGPNHREAGVQLRWKVLPALDLHAGWQHSWAGEDVRRDGGDDLSWGQAGLTSYF